MSARGGTAVMSGAGRGASASAVGPAATVVVALPAVPAVAFALSPRRLGGGAVVAVTASGSACGA